MGKYRLIRVRRLEATVRSAGYAPEKTYRGLEKYVPGNITFGNYASVDGWIYSELAWNAAKRAAEKYAEETCSPNQIPHDMMFDVKASGSADVEDLNTGITETISFSWNSWQEVDAETMAENILLKQATI